MATNHRTTMAPTKLELLVDWLPRQPWYRSTGEPPTLTRAGGFRLDDPAGEVGIEFIFVTDGVEGEETTYHVPLAYRGAPLPDAEEGLLGTSEHGVLGRRRPTARLPLRRDRGTAPERERHPDPSVGRDRVPVEGRLTASSPLRVSNRGPGWTTVDIELTDGSSAEAGQLSLDLIRVLAGEAYTGLGHVEADWTRLDGATARGPVVVVR